MGLPKVIDDEISSRKGDTCNFRSRRGSKNYVLEDITNKDWLID